MAKKPKTKSARNKLYKQIVENLSAIEQAMTSMLAEQFTDAELRCIDAALDDALSHTSNSLFRIFCAEREKHEQGRAAAKAATQKAPPKKKGRTRG